MHPMKLPPFTSCQRPQNRMIGNGFSLAESSIALGNDALHTRDILKNFSAKLRDRGAARKHALRGLPPGREESQPEYSSALPPLGPAVRACARFSHRQTALTIFNGAAVSQIQVVQYFC